MGLERFVMIACAVAFGGCSLLAGADSSELSRPARGQGDAGPSDPTGDAAIPDAPAPTCTGGSRCTGGTLTWCDGDVERTQPCALGCGSETRCEELVPSNLDKWTWQPNLEGVTVDESITVDTDACGPFFPGAPKGFAEKQKPLGDFAAPPELCVYALGSLVVEDDAVVEVRGSRALVIVASGTIDIRGVLDASARPMGAGPGGGAGGASGGGRPGAGGGPFGGELGEERDRSNASGGGGGGGLCGAGGDGSDAGNAAGGDGGGTVGNDWALTPLVGGSGGGMGAPRPGAGGFGGHGGGAVQLTSAEAVLISGAVLAAGSGGLGGENPIPGDWGAGGGGGSGGALLLEAPVVSLDGKVILAGGGGGGAAFYLEAGEDGDGGATAQDGRASGGAGAYDEGGGGGGSAPEDEDGDDGEEARDDSQANGGGGGGGAGCVLVRAKSWSAEGATLHPTGAPGFRTLAPATR